MLENAILESHVEVIAIAICDKFVVLGLLLSVICASLLGSITRKIGTAREDNGSTITQSSIY